MKTEINITIDESKLYIREVNCLPEEYEISEDWPTIVHEVCEYLHDYLEGLN